jgi:hypothetical protein
MSESGFERFLGAAALAALAFGAAAGFFGLGAAVFLTTGFTFWMIVRQQTVE